MNKQLVYLEKLLFYTLLFLIPTQLAFHFWPDFALVFGIRIDYLAPAIYLTDLLIVALIVLGFSNGHKTFKNSLPQNKLMFLLVVAFAFINIVFSSNSDISFYKWLKIGELYLFFTYVKNRISIFDRNKILNSLLVSSVLFSSIGILQFLLKSTVSPLLHFLGERSFNVSTPGIALVSIFGTPFMRAYSTFSHPNSLAGFLGSILIFLLLSKKYKTLSDKLALLIISICVLLTFSVSTLISLVFVYSVYLLKNAKFSKVLVRLMFFFGIISSLLLTVFSKNVYSLSLEFGSRVSERINLSYVSGKMMTDRFLIGEGFNTFIVNIPHFKGVTDYSRILQPVHNVLLLSFAELGIVGLLLVLSFFYRYIKQIGKGHFFGLIILFVFLTGLFDHYWVTLQQNMLILTFFAALLDSPYFFKK